MNFNLTNSLQNWIQTKHPDLIWASADSRIIRTHLTLGLSAPKTIILIQLTHSLEVKYCINLFVRVTMLTWKSSLHWLQGDRNYCKDSMLQSTCQPTRVHYMVETDARDHDMNIKCQIEQVQWKRSIRLDMARPFPVKKFKGDFPSANAPLLASF